jgi:hypothetical protein
MITGKKPIAAVLPDGRADISRLGGILIHERGIAFNPVTGETFRLVGPARQLIRLLQEGTPPSDLLAYLVENYEVEEPTARRDLDTFMATLEDMGWVEAT